VWVAAGTYLERITLHPYAYVHGGYATSGTQGDGRDRSANLTVLDGQLLGSVVTVQAGNMSVPSTVSRSRTVAPISAAECTSTTRGRSLRITRSQGTALLTVAGYTLRAPPRF